MNMWQIAYKGKLLGKPMGRKQAESVMYRVQNTLIGLSLVEVEG